MNDATGANFAAYGPLQLRTENQGAECDPAVPLGSAPVLASLRGTRRHAVTRRSGRASVLGRLEGASAGVRVALLARELRASAGAGVAATTVTSPDGSFTLRVPAGPSRRLRAGWRVRGTDPFYACSRPLEVRVPARTRLRVSPRVVSPGGRVRISGRLLSRPIPARGKVIDVQARDRGCWRTFDTVRARRSGRFATHYRFDIRRRRATYPMRVRVRPDAAYPYALGYSRVVRVRVR